MPCETNFNPLSSYSAFRPGTAGCFDSTWPSATKVSSLSMASSTDIVANYMITASRIVRSVSVPPPSVFDAANDLVAARPTTVQRASNRRGQIALFHHRIGGSQPSKRCASYLAHLAVVASRSIIPHPGANIPRHSVDPLHLTALTMAFRGVQLVLPTFKIIGVRTTWCQDEFFNTAEFFAAGFGIECVLSYPSAVWRAFGPLGSLGSGATTRVRIPT
jgi:hypothetical protein